MKYTSLIISLLASIAMIGCTGNQPKTTETSEFNYPEGSPVAIHGALQVKGLQLCDQKGDTVQLAGMSTMGWQWCADCYTDESIKNLVDNWHINILRLAMYIDEGGYNTNPEESRDMMCKLIETCGRLGIYCIVDWHILTPGHPENKAYTDAFGFISYIANRYAGAPHVIYEICNEPNGNDATWEAIASYANKIVPVIHWAAESVKAPHPIVICGTPQWDQLVDAPLKEGRYQGNNMDLDAQLPDRDARLKFDNIMYTFHFYSASHNEGFPKDGKENYYNMYEYIYDVLGKLPVFCSEYGTVEASGAGTPDFDRTDKWLLMLRGNNAGKQKVSFCNWSYSDKDEGSAALLPGSCKEGKWDNVSSSGDYIKRVMAVVNSGVEDTTVLKPSNLYVSEKNKK